ncbi:MULTISPECIES: cytochrome c [unclassified Rhodanobacter]|uniref:c-type cytochrome n=1 Tax=unclassified Rhodanobacter TaxID=2621553 RepID=UPI001BDDD0C7|nr:MULTISPECIES: cytochrome c [unclassified Rhodanobacter]MBT2144054.1 cytochrome c [Rhodanobacter sp. LX-99]MBT2146872.1 cytochrome c [Rhodanobacter sp. LX-100]
MNTPTRCLPLLALLGLLVTAPAGAADTPDAALLQRGQYLATAGDCVACHTAPGGKPYAGGLTVPTPIGNIIATNITPSTTAGIGHYTEQQFSDAVRKGIRADGARLYPAMPYTSYAQVTDDDVHALYAYFMHGVAPVDSKPAPTRLPFPFNLRFSMAGWNLLFLDSKPFAPDPAKGAAWNRGAYLVRGLAHCSTCHTPRNLLMAERSSRELAGGMVGTWVAPNITSDANSGIGGWSEQDLVDYLQLGHARGKAQAAGPMAEAVEHSLQHLEPADLQAIATYLKTVPAQHGPADTRAVDRWGAAFDGMADQRGTALPDDAEQWSGAQLYDAHCASCHQASGEGSFDGGLPPLFHNTATGRTDTNNLVLVILEGIRWQTGDSGVRMPGFAGDLSDQRIATLGNYLTLHYGNPAARITATQVANLRAGGAPSHLVALARLAMVVVVALILAILVLWRRRRRRRTSSGQA